MGSAPARAAALSSARRASRAASRSCLRSVGGLTDGFAFIGLEGADAAEDAGEGAGAAEDGGAPGLEGGFVLGGGESGTGVALDGGEGVEAGGGGVGGHGRECTEVRPHREQRSGQVDETSTNSESSHIRSACEIQSQIVLAPFADSARDRLRVVQVDALVDVADEIRRHPINRPVFE